MNNKLIAEFMGNDTFMSDSGYDWIDHKGHAFRSFDEMPYQTSWDWIIPVVEKIESINLLNDEYYSDYTFTVTNFVQNWTANFIDRNNVEIVTAEGETRIESVYKAVVEFIKYYNDSQNQTQS